MSKEMSFEDVLKFAIEQENQSVKIYTELLEKAKTPQAKEAFGHFVEIEKGHAHKLQNFKKEMIEKKKDRQIVDLKISDYLVEMNPEADLDYRDILVIAAKREDRTRKLYEDLAQKYSDDPELKELFEFLANEEAQHKHDVEVMYDEDMAGDN